jgi:transposase
METTTKRKRYEKQFKLDAVRLAQQQGNSVASVARDLGIDANTLHHWKRQFSNHDMDAFPGNGCLMPDDAERRRLEREIATLSEENAMLKKAMGYFAKHGK